MVKVSVFRESSVSIVGKCEEVPHDVNPISSSTRAPRIDRSLDTTMSKPSVNTFFSAGLGRGGRLAAWAVAFAGAVRIAIQPS